MKQKMKATTKAKIIYSAELGVFAVVFLVIGLLEMLKVIHIREIVLTIFNWVTLFGGAWMIADFVWLMASKKRQKKASKLDKSLLLPLGIYLITFDLYCLIGKVDKVEQYDIYRFCISGALLYIAVIYAFEAVYHWFHPVPGLIESIEEAEAQEAKEASDIRNIDGDVPEEQDDQKDDDASDNDAENAEGE